MANQFSSLCISLLTELLDLNSLEDLLDEQRESFVVRNIRTELGDDAALKVDVLTDVGVASYNGNSEKKEKKFHKRLIKSTSKESSHVFGGRLNENSVQIMVKIMEHLKDYTNVEGLFRISGNKRRQEDLKEALNKGHSVDLADMKYSQHDLTTILKQFFAELSEPLMTDSLYNCYKQVAGKTREMDGKVSIKKRLIALQLLSLLLPPLNRRLFKELIQLLYLVSRKTVNLMTAKNLAVVFAPNIAAKMKISCMTDYSDSLEPLTDIIEFLIDNAEQVFKVPDELFDSKQKCMTGARVLGTPKVFCKQFDPRHYQQETVKTTNDALAELYTQVVNMPDSHPMKKQFLSDFKRKYPGTPPFVPKCRREGIESPVVNKTPLASKRKVEGSNSNSSNDFDKHDGMFLSTPEKRRLFTEGDLADHKTPDGKDLDYEQPPNDNIQKPDTIPEKRKRFRRPSFTRPSFGFFSKRSSPDLRKMPSTTSTSASSTGKRTRSSSANSAVNEDSDGKRRFSFTPFLDRKFSQHKSATERKPPKRLNKVGTSSKIVKNIKFDSKDNTEQSKPCELCDKLPNGKNSEMKAANRLKPELRAPLMKIQSNGRSLMPNSTNIRRETLALHREQKSNIDAFRPRRETLAIHRDSQPTIVPFKPRKEHFDCERGQPILESFKPKRDSLLIHKKCQPAFEQMKCVAKEIYEESEINSNGQKLSHKEFEGDKENHDVRKMSVNRREKKSRFVDREVNSPIKFTSFGKANMEVNQQFELLNRRQMHVRRMSTGSIRRSDWTELRKYEDGCMVTFL